MIEASRPEIGAHLAAVALEAADPRSVAEFFARTMGMRISPERDGLRCYAADRHLLISSGRANRLRTIEFAFPDATRLEAYRRRVTARIALEPVEPDDTRFAMRDPDGTRIVFGWGERNDEATNVPPARLQHLGLRSPQPERLLEFYRDQLGFVLSDRIDAPPTGLRAAFLRSDEEHHTIALFLAPEARLDHLSFDTTDMVAIRDWADHMAAADAPIFWGVGRHGPGNDVFFMVKDPEGNLVEISSELERCAPERPVGQWPYTDKTLNLWGTGFKRS